MDNRETLYLNFQNANNEEIGNSVYVDPIFSDNEFKIFEIYKSKSADNYGFFVQNLGIRLFHLAIKNNGIPYIFDINNSKVISGPLSQMQCRIGNMPYTIWKGITS